MPQSALMALTQEITPAMMQSFAALLLAHVVADFTFQTRWMVDRKRNFFVMLLHILIVFAFSTAALGGVWQVALVVSLAHFVIDALKVWALPEGRRDTLGAFLADQMAHLLTLVAAALWWPQAAAQGSWSQWLDLALAPALILSGLIITVWAGGFAVGHLTARFPDQVSEDSLPDAGRLIGQLERVLIFILVMIGQPAGIGFLIAAKSILRFDTAAQGQKAGEYVIIGTLASFTWALAMSYATHALLEIAASAP
ncbi:DUF3307 domain-containing protein [Primorskyibacter sp. 2E233]|uniref:DUF3307 domain-containing protein n=1 Tax=Primorskyibacter sp. 2E233 TaxID=3413431 RepID=UPI003BF0A601